MNLRKSLIKLAYKLEATWQKVELSALPIMLDDGWYITEFMVQGSISITPRIIVRDNQGNDHERTLIGYHAGRNRMLIFLEKGQLTAYSKSVEFKSLARVSTLEGRARILLICFRYLLDFFSLKVLGHMIVMQFNKRATLSTDLLSFYSPATDDYLKNIQYWNYFKRLDSLMIWWARTIKIAILIEDESQRPALEKQIVMADHILTATDELPSDVDYLIVLSKTEALVRPAVLMLKLAIKKFKHKPLLIYTDHDYSHENAQDSRVAVPVFKPQASRAYLHCFNYIAPSTVFSRSALEGVQLAELLNEEQLYRLSLKCFSTPSEVVHIPEALIRSDRLSPVVTPGPDSQESPWQNILWQRRDDYNVLLANPAWQDHPSVDLVIPTRDGLSVLKPCIESILSKTSYRNFKIIIVDNGSEQASTHAFFDTVTKDPRVQVVSYPGEFNYSAINNFAVAQGDSDYIALVNNDIEVIHPDWLTQMMAWVTQENVGIVGAKLLFGNEKVQHAGVTIGMGNAAGHIHRLEDGDAPGYQLRCLATQNMMAVTAACLVTPRALYESVGGLDEQSFKVAYNDIDYCLRVEQSGLEIIWTPEARLYHHESVSRGDDMSEVHIERYFNELSNLQKRWKTKGFVDKYYSPHLRISDEGVFPQMSRLDDDDLHFL